MIDARLVLWQLLVDPRTGGIIQGRVSLGSLRDRQDFLIAEGFALGERHEHRLAAASRWCSRANLGHTRWATRRTATQLRHESGQSSIGDGLPAPRAKLDANGLPDLSEAYSTGVGEWDKSPSRMVIRIFLPNERAAGARRDTARGFRTRTDVPDGSGTRVPPGSASSVAHLWDNGTNAIDELAT